MCGINRIPNALSNRDTVFFVAEKDAILNAKRVVRYLQDHGVRKVQEGGNLHFMEGVAHGMCTNSAIVPPRTLLTKSFLSLSNAGEALITGKKHVTLVMDWLSSR